MMKIYVIRHAQCENSAPKYYDDSKRAMNPPLTELGERQARLLGESLSGVKFDRVYSSDLTRAVKTADALGAKDIVLSEDFREIDMGALYFKPWEEFPNIREKWLAREEDIAYPCGECGNDVWKRCERGLDMILRAGGENIALVTHGGAIRSIVCGILGLPQQKRFMLGAPVGNCSYSVIAENEGALSLHSFNVPLCFS